MAVIKIIIFFVFCAVFFTGAMAQLKIIQAIGGEGKSIDWQKITVEDNSSEHSQFFYHFCPEGVLALSASSTLTSQWTSEYKVENLTDNNPMTAWAEGVPGYGIDEWFEIKAKNINVIYNGYQASPGLWEKNSRVKRFKVYMDGNPLCYLDLTDEMGMQRFELPFESDNLTEHVFRFEIKEVYKGILYDNVCISHIDYFLC
jgi:hypothetical protein